MSGINRTRKAFGNQNMVDAMGQVGNRKIITLIDGEGT